MKKFVYSAVALAMATGASYAADTGWASLDQEISGLSSSLSAQNAGGPKVGGWVITSVNSNSDNDVLGFDLNEVRLHVTGDVSNDYSYKVSFEFEDGDAVLKDAYIKWKLMDNISGTMGQFYIPTFRSATSDETKLLFLNRTLNGTLLRTVGIDGSGRDQGLMVGGGFEMLNFGVAVQDGLDGDIDEFRITLNVTADVMGKGAGAVEGAYGAAEGTNLSVGGFYHMDDGAGANGFDVFGVEAYFTMGALAVAGEFADYDALDVSPYSVTASYLFTEMYEAAVRYEDADDAADTSIISAGVNRYSAGHNLKWTAQFVTASSDTAALETDTISIGATLAF
jgi:hypothetical protein